MAADLGFSLLHDAAAAAVGRYVRWLVMTRNDKSPLQAFACFPLIIAFNLIVEFEAFQFRLELACIQRTRQKPT